MKLLKWQISADMYDVKALGLRACNDAKALGRCAYDDAKVLGRCACDDAKAQVQLNFRVTMATTVTSSGDVLTGRLSYHDGYDCDVIRRRAYSETFVSRWLPL